QWSAQCSHPSRQVAHPSIARQHASRNLDGRCEREEDAGGTREPGEKAGHRGQPPSLATKAEERDGGESDEHRLGIRERQDEGGRNQSEEKGCSLCRAPVSLLSRQPI